jgi:serine/threonine protein kinase
MPHCSLFTALHSTESCVAVLLTDLTTIPCAVALGMQDIHSRRLIHRDLKSLNVLLDRQNQPRICDFGISICDAKARAPGPCC